MNLLVIPGIYDYISLNMLIHMDLVLVNFIGVSIIPHGHASVSYKNTLQHNRYKPATGNLRYSAAHELKHFTRHHLCLC